ncbi:TetR/AcrR family transcriptional regulator [Ramlibacter henchirensis]|uniref:TetR/AcrR family transcriptional regulator n=1 Tax=Ramlibacter henchirensis TaxID=204072 RepID=A0A4Z0C1T0_9BURK|nr:TetR/AcrR family transcriptional regulator [Ramlibacter henchirensis]TFZ05577.1 TetR/AcrR family transcriptional regulator [Ramlibacter henchirensis]
MDMAPSNRKQLTHDRILDTAAGVLRESGFGGVGVADIMKRAGLTHGGFYAHFPSRDALLVEALDRAGQDSHARLQRSVASLESKSASRFRALVDSYLSERHLKSAESGCPVAALASELPRQSEAVRTAGAARVTSLISAVQAALSPDHPAEAAGIAASQLVGALQIARALGDNARGRRHLAASRRFLLEQFENAPRRDKSR